MKFNIREYDRKFKAQSTAKLKKNYSHYNSDYRLKAREELKRRGVKTMPYKYKKRVVRNNYGIPSMFRLRL